ncbi:hypothetical protein EG329_012708 [Mollisiaceae sp. DMI_Dod_QoI]|nr:hypothetical protein EG329_012708 [Helotiales sp. DMI_Dod_QoI]
MIRSNEPSSGMSLRAYVPSSLKLDVVPSIQLELIQSNESVNALFHEAQIQDVQHEVEAKIWVRGAGEYGGKDCNFRQIWMVERSSAQKSTTMSFKCKNLQRVVHLGEKTDIGDDLGIVIPEASQPSSFRSYAVAMTYSSKTIVKVNVRGRKQKLVFKLPELDVLPAPKEPEPIAFSTEKSRCENLISDKLEPSNLPEYIELVDQNMPIGSCMGIFRTSSSLRVAMASSKRARVYMSSSYDPKNYDFPIPSSPASFSADCWNSSLAQAEYIYGLSFTSCPSKFFLRNLLATAASSSGWSWDTTRPRFDNTGYRYLGRSYGIGASVGLADSVAAAIVTTVPTWTLASIQAGDDGAGIPSIFKATGGGYGDYVQWSYDGNSTITAIGIANLSLALAAGTSYDILNKAKCNISFTPTEFNITVNRPDLTIDVKPNGTVDRNLDPEYHLRSLVESQLQAISQFDTTLYESALGDALLTNINLVERYEWDHPDPEHNADESLAAIGLSFQNVIDQILVGVLSAQIVYLSTLPIVGYNDNWTMFRPPSQFYNETVIACWEVVQIGSLTFACLAFALNALILLIIVFAMCYYGFWIRLLPFNYTDMQSVVLATAAGGADIMDEVLSIEKKIETEAAEHRVKNEINCRKFLCGFGKKEARGFDKLQELNKRRGDVKVKLTQLTLEDATGDSTRFALLSSNTENPPSSGKEESKKSARR